MNSDNVEVFEILDLRLNIIQQELRELISFMREPLEGGRFDIVMGTLRRIDIILNDEIKRRNASDN